LFRESIRQSDLKKRLVISSKKIKNDKLEEFKVLIDSNSNTFQLEEGDERQKLFVPRDLRRVVADVEQEVQRLL